MVAGNFFNLGDAEEAFLCEEYQQQFSDEPSKLQSSLNKVLKGVRNHIKLGVSPRILYCVVDTGYELGGSLWDCRPELPKVPNG